MDGKGEEQREHGGQRTLGEKIAERAASVGNFQDCASYSQPDFVADYDRFFDIVDDQVAARLRTDGFAVVDGIFGSDWAHAFLDELQWLTKKNLLIENRTQFTNAQGERIIVRKPNIFEVDLHMEMVRTKVPQMDALFRQRHFVRALAAQLPEFGLREGPNGVTVKLQHNKGCGACFPLHYDNPGRPSNRKLTCLVYLNPDWKKGDGGELKLFPLLQEPVTIEPTFDRCVMFVSDLVLHRVLPSYAPRYCFTIWIDGEGTNKDEDLALRWRPDEDLDRVGRRLDKSPCQRSISRAVLADEYETSLRECMAGSDGVEDMLASHANYLEKTKANVPLWHLVRHLQQMREHFCKEGCTEETAGEGA